MEGGAFDYLLNPLIGYVIISVGLRIFNSSKAVKTVTLTKRVELLLDPDQYAQLDQIAKNRKESLSALIRQALEKEYLQPTLEQRRAAVERLLSQETEFGAWAQVKKDIFKEVLREIEAS